MHTSFETLGLRAELVRAVNESNYTQPTEIQSLAIPPILSGRDVFGQAQTGTGKTAAFTLPLLSNLQPTGKPQALILTPTRELALQVATAVERYGQFMKVRVVSIYGGQSYVRQQRQIERGTDVIVGTPGRLLDLMEKQMIDLSTIKYVVLDEADEMLKMGFIDDVETILIATPLDRQTALFSATLPESIRHLAQKYMRDPLFVNIPTAEMTVAQIEQQYVLVHGDSKIPALSRLLETEDIQSALVFTRTRAGAMELSESLIKRGYLVDVISGDLSQEARETVLRRFRNGDLPVLVATDVVARGVDIPAVSHVFNFDMPLDQEDYVHRIGRTGRAGRSGIAITLVTPDERRRLRYLEHFIQHKLTEIRLPKLEDIRARRKELFMKRLEVTLEKGEMELGMEAVSELLQAGYDMTEVAAAAIQLARAAELARPVDHVKTIREEAPRRERGAYKGEGFRREHREDATRHEGNGNGNGKPRRSSGQEAGMVRLVLNIGRSDGIKPGDIVGTIAAHAGIPGKAIGAIDIRQEDTYVDVQDALVERVLSKMKRGHIKGKPVKLVRA
jgi:ATP-dependent RNA helicase DeaD